MGRSARLSDGEDDLLCLLMVTVLALRYADIASGNHFRSVQALQVFFKLSVMDAVYCVLNVRDSNLLLKSW